ncbi:MAG: hypothetical protein HZA61_08595 [Candidatus Eisenbacteria bacterium]|uniref:Uncharacterized protein n=1 Tax=Eiseniibacteriota bacterium TaxID=2212470 RepID=A0A933SBN0_UNCEI|nr:hypothetical protein [Candidatus Eisenbacteria bacterium]
MSRGRPSSLRDFFLYALFNALLRGMGLVFAVSWRLFNRTLGAVAGRRLEHCREIYLYPAQALGMLASLLLLSGVVGLTVPGPVGSPWAAVVALAMGAAALALARFLIRRGCL